MNLLNFREFLKLLLLLFASLLKMLSCSIECLISEETVTQHLQKVLSLVKGGKIFKVSLIHFDKSSIMKIDFGGL